MPIYEYACTECSYRFEIMKPISEVNSETLCPKCGCSAKRIFSRFASFSKDSTGISSPIAGTGSSCDSCTAPSCSSCGL